MKFDDDIGLLLKAIGFSAEKHRNQRRKDIPHSPYINHPIEVLETLWELGGVRDEAILLAAILHDTIEDTNTTAEEIEVNFGPEVLSLVLEVSDDKSLPKAIRKQLQIETAPHKSEGAKLIKLADKLCNVRDTLYSPPVSWTRKRQMEYLLWTEKVVQGLRGINQSMEEAYDSLMAEGKRKFMMKGM
jgi:guanosine-3',5'-bis(diphosphate) 3'-pyrophosphohydrolase